MDFTATTLITDRAPHDYLPEIAQHAHAISSTDIAELTETILGFPLALRAFHIRGVHHVAIYIGDYRREDDLAAWVEFLSRSAAVSNLAWGPSYIMPRYYDVPGYWLSCTLEGASVEMFTAKRTDEWGLRKHEWKIRRLSHVAAAVDDARHVRPVLDYLAHYPDIDLLCHTAGDELGHSYGHLLNRRTNRVLELVYDSQQRQN